jgi:EpsG family
MYWLLFALPAVVAVQRLQWGRDVWAMWALTLVLLVGLRFEVGGDWGAYLKHFRLDSQLSFEELFEGKEYGFHILNWAVYQMGAGPWLVNLLCAGVFVLGLLRFCKDQPRPFLALAVAVPYMVIVVGMGYQRQAVALGLFMWGLVDLAQRRHLRFVAAVVLGTLFHQTVLIVLPLAALANTRNRYWSALWVGLLGGALYQFILAENVDSLWAGYVTSGYASEGGAIRVFMNALPAAVFLLWRKRWGEPAQTLALWTWVALFCLALLPLVSLASTAVDRVALYFMPIQLWVWSRVPGLLAPSHRLHAVLAVVLASAAVQVVWLFFATHSQYWLPYQFWPVVWLEGVL